MAGNSLEKGHNYTVSRLADLVLDCATCNSLAGLYGGARVRCQPLGTIRPVNQMYMLDVCIYSYIMREQPEAVLKRLAQAVLHTSASWSRPYLLRHPLLRHRSEGFAAPYSAVCPS